MHMINVDTKSENAALSLQPGQPMKFYQNFQ